MKCKICQSGLKLQVDGVYDNRHGYPGRFDIYQCSSCGFCQTYPEPTGAELDRLYTDYYPRKGLDTSQVKASAISISGFKDRLAIWLNGTNNSCHLYAKPGMRVLDYGCGTGVSLLEIQNLGAEAFGIEVDENVKTVAEALSLRIHFGRLDDLPYPDQFFDLITLSQVIEHIPDPLQLLLSLKVKLKSNGKIILSCPNANALNRRILGRRWLHWHVPYHLNHFTKTSIGLLLRQAGLEIISIRTITPNLWSVLQLHSLLISPEEGCRDTSWDLVKNDNKLQGKQKTILESISLKAINVSFRKNGIVFAPYNRIVDTLGLGESLLVKACMAD